MQTLMKTSMGVCRSINHDRFDIVMEVFAGDDNVDVKSCQHYFFDHKSKVAEFRKDTWEGKPIC
jgi:hypothetical protein